MAEKNRLSKILKSGWRVNVDDGHKSAVRHKMSELESIEPQVQKFEYADGELTTTGERIRTRTVIRTDWRPVWAAAMILLAVVIIMVPRSNISGNSLIETQSGTPQELLFKGFAPLGSKLLKENEAQILIHKNSSVEKRYIYMISGITFDSKHALTIDQIRSVFRNLTGEDLGLKEISLLEVMVPKDYYIQTKDGGIICYGVTRVKNE